MVCSGSQITFISEALSTNSFFFLHEQQRVTNIDQAASKSNTEQTMVEVQYSRCFSRLASFKARFYNAAPAALERIVQDEQKVNLQVRTSEASFMSVRKRLGSTSGGTLAGPGCHCFLTQPTTLIWDSPLHDVKPASVLMLFLHLSADARNHISQV